MAYIDEPPWAKWAQRAALSTRYILLGILGALAATMDGHGPLLAAAGWVIAVTCSLALAGVVAHYYRLEWVPLGPMIAALLWVAVLIGHRADGAVTLLVVALAATQVDRLIHLTRVALKLRRRAAGG